MWKRWEKAAITVKAAVKAGRRARRWETLRLRRWTSTTTTSSANLPFVNTKTLQEMGPTESIRFEFGKDKHGFAREAFLFVMEDTGEGGE